jgi:hypothetical protein
MFVLVRFTDLRLKTGDPVSPFKLEHGRLRLEIASAKSFKKDARIVWRRLEDCGVEFES